MYGTQTTTNQLKFTASPTRESEDAGDSDGVTKQKPVFSRKRLARGADTNIVQYFGIAADEPERIERHSKKPNVKLPLVEAGWSEKMCFDWCEKNGLLAPTYATNMRDGCWFCHNQNVNSLRDLRHDHPDLWAQLLKWDTDSPVTFHADGRTVHDFDRRFQIEDAGLADPKKRFRWALLEQFRPSLERVENETAADWLDRILKY